MLLFLTLNQWEASIRHRVLSLYCIVVYSYIAAFSSLLVLISTLRCSIPHTESYHPDKAYDRKMRGTAEDCLAQGIVFLPIAAEAPGGWHEVAVNKVKKLATATATAVARQSGQEEGVVVHHAFTRLSMLLQQGNAAILGNRIPSHAAALTDGVEEGDG